MGQKNLKKVQAKKKLLNSNNSISRKNFFDQNSLFAISKMAKYQFFELGKSLKIQFQVNLLLIIMKNVKIKIREFDFTSF